MHPNCKIIVRVRSLLMHKQADYINETLNRFINHSINSLIIVAADHSYSHSLIAVIRVTSALSL